MNDKERIEALDALLNDGVIGINGGKFVIDQTALLSAMEKTDRLLLVRILSKVEGKRVEDLLTETIDLDIKHLAETLENTTKHAL